MKYFKKLIGENIYLAPKSLEDAEKFAEWMNDFHTTDYLGRSSQIMPLECEKEHLQSKIKSEADFGIVTLKEDKLLGSCGIYEIDHIDRKGTLGIFIGEREARGKGYGAEAIRLLLDYGFNYLNLNNINLDVLSFNERAIKCYQKCGFKEYGRRRKCKFINGKYYNKVSMDILAEEFKETYIKNKNF